MTVGADRIVNTLAASKLFVRDAIVVDMLNFATHPGAKAAKPETFIDNSILAELGKSGFVDKLYK